MPLKRFKIVELIFSANGGERVEIGAEAVEDRWLRVAEAVDDFWLVSKRSAKFIDSLGIAACIQEVANSAHLDREMYGGTEPEADLLQCAVCKRWKEPSYFKHPSMAPEVRFCRYCRYKIRTEIIRVVRELRGLKPRSDVLEEVGPPHAELVAEFLRGRREGKDVPVTPAIDGCVATRPTGYPVSPRMGRVREGISRFGIPAEPALWDGQCDLILEWFLRRYGIFFEDFERDIESQIRFHLHPSFRWERTDARSFLEWRISELKPLAAIFEADEIKRSQLAYDCEVCEATAEVHQIHFDHICWSDGQVLPLCRKCWSILRGALRRDGHERAPSDVRDQIDQVLGNKICPVCEKRHTWRDDAWNYTDGFYGVPLRFREICFDCLNEAINKAKAGGTSVRANREALLEISKLIDAPPHEEMASVVFDQAQSLDVAVKVVEVMKTMWTFRRLKNRHEKSWFKVLVKSGCLSQGARKEVFGTRVLAKDGHECLSMGEMEIDNLFYKHKIKHRKEVRYPDADYICDWVIMLDGREVFVEYFGLIGQEAYDRKCEAKRELMSSSGRELIEFVPEDFKDLRAAFTEKILMHSGKSHTKN